MKVKLSNVCMEGDKVPNLLLVKIAVKMIANISRQSY